MIILQRQVVRDGKFPKFPDRPGCSDHPPSLVVAAHTQATGVPGGEPARESADEPDRRPGSHPGELWPPMAGGSGLAGVGGVGIAGNRPPGPPVGVAPCPGPSPDDEPGVNPAGDLADLDDLRSTALASILTLDAVGRDPEATDDEYDDFQFDVVGPAIRAYADAAGHPADAPPFVVAGRERRTMFLWVAGGGVVKVPLTAAMMGGGAGEEATA